MDCAENESVQIKNGTLEAGSTIKKWCLFD